MQDQKSSLAPGGFDPLRTAWDLLTNVKFALLLVGMALVLGMIGTVLPQVPAPMRENVAARSAWLELQRDTYGGFTGPMDSVGLFDVFHSPWFNGLWALIIVAVTVCTVSRFRPTWRSVQRPQMVVADGYFERAHHRASFTHEGGVEAIESILKKRRYRVERAEGADPGATYLFADRFGWTHYGTFVSHLALLMLLVGALLTTMAGFDKTFVFAEGAPEAAIFDDPGPNQMFVSVSDAYRGLDEDGNIIDYYSMITVRRGDETKVCKTTVNDPCHAFGYKVHQAAWFNDVARLRITNAEGRVVFDDNVDFDSQVNAVPVFKVTNTDGAVLYNADLPQMGTDPGTQPTRADDTALAVLGFPLAPGSPLAQTYEVGWRVTDGNMVVAVSGPEQAPVSLAIGESTLIGEYRVELVGARNVPATVIADLPGGPDLGGVAIQMPTNSNGEPYLFVSGLDAENKLLAMDRPVRATDDYTYTFKGQVEASGLSIRRDPGDTFIWLAVGMALVGLATTFYIPRRRLWIKVTPERTAMAGIAERTTRLSREMRLMGAQLGSADALQPGDELRES